jgi:hypothetical protein
MKNFKITAYALDENQPIHEIVCFSDDVDKAMIIATTLAEGFRAVEITDEDGLIYYSQTISTFVCPKMDKTPFEAIDWTKFYLDKHQENKGE